jgi:hypothetical protein
LIGGSDRAAAVPSVRTRVQLLIVAATITAVGGCGANDPAPTPAPPKTTPITTPLGAPGSVTSSAGSIVPLGISETQLVKRLGAPASPLHSFPDGFRCSLYRIAEEPPFVKLRYCFAHGRLKFFSTYAVEGGG